MGASPREFAILNFNGHPAPAPERIDRGFDLPAMGDASEVRRWISDALADVEWREAQGVLVADRYRLSFDVPAAGTLHGFLVRVEGGLFGWAEAVGALVHLCQIHGWAALDCDVGQFLDVELRGDEPPQA